MDQVEAVRVTVRGRAIVGGDNGEACEAVSGVLEVSQGRVGAFVFGGVRRSLRSVLASPAVILKRYPLDQCPTAVACRFETLPSASGETLRIEAIETPDTEDTPPLLISTVTGADGAHSFVFVGAWEGAEVTRAGNAPRLHPSPADTLTAVASLFSSVETIDLTG